jgi:DNA replication protein DnaC
MSDPKTLPPLPPNIRLLTESEMSRLRASGKFFKCKTCKSTNIARPNTFTGVDGDTYICNCRDQYKLWLYLSYAGLGYRYMQYRWADLETRPPEIQNVLSDYIANFPEYADRGLGLVLHSPNTGTGKTLIASLLFKTLLELGNEGFFTTFADMLDMFTAGWKNQEDQRWFDQQVRQAGVLVIDDIGREAAYRRAVADDLLDSVIRSRAYHGRPTIITTNFSLDQLRERYSHNIVSLLEESFFFCDVSGEDRREQVKLRLQEEAKSKIVRPVTLGD